MDVSEKVLRRQVVLMSELVGRNLAGPDKLDGFIFNDCQIVGPAVLFVIEGNNFNDSTFEAKEVFNVAEPDRPYYGVIGLYNCTFEKCRFERIGILAPQQFVDLIQSEGS